MWSTLDTSSIYKMWDMLRGIPFTLFFIISCNFWLTRSLTKLDDLWWVIGILWIIIKIKELSYSESCLSCPLSFSRLSRSVVACLSFEKLTLDWLIKNGSYSLLYILYHNFRLLNMMSLTMDLSTTPPGILFKLRCTWSKSLLDFDFNPIQ